MSKYLLEQYIKETLKEQKVEKQKDEKQKVATWKDLRTLLSADEKSDVIKTMSKAVLKDIFELFNPTNSFSNTLKAFSDKVTPDLVSKIKENVKSKYVDFFKQNYDINGKENVGNNPFKVDSNISLIIDDRLEEEFLNYVIKSYNNKDIYPDNAFIRDNFDMTTKLQTWLETKSKGASVYNKENPPIKDKLNPWKT